MVMGRNECGSNAMVTVQMTVEEYLEMKSRQETKEVTTKQKNLVYDLEGINWKWVKWAISESEHFFCDIDEVIKERKKDIKILQLEDQLDFGKYKGKTIQEVYSIDPNYLMWLNENSEDFVIDFSGLNR